ncbi:MAG: arginyl-tRNA synthetase [Limisphaerales bacterium]|nr:MAG: arginyl-tRNA synthetase [Limisphaerales bacterium]KAG0508665.1 MAG: arginyl-tRNA synthetase [Limisphaerales bacterium]TXT48738.1 MAG: arginyl-tRNA synthetase [Limisphaerales bacterium]
MTARPTHRWFPFAVRLSRADGLKRAGGLGGHFDRVHRQAVPRRPAAPGPLHSTLSASVASLRAFLEAMLHLTLQAKLQAAVRAVLPDADTAAILVRPCPDARHGDYQSNALIPLAKQRKLNPRQLAEQVKAALDVADLCDAVDIAGPGFLNFRIRPAALAAVLQTAARGEHLFFAQAAQPRTVVIDFSSPNVAKPMHVGHIRSTGIGDALQRVFRLLGHRVITDNHIGDWGTQFGKLLLGWKQILDRDALARDAIAELERLYRVINAECDANPARLEEAKQELVKLQAGDAENIAVWQEMIRVSQAQFDAIYGRLGVKFDHALGESFYNPQLGSVVDDLLARGIARESEGAVGVFSAGSVPPKSDPFLVNRDGEWVPDPALVRKSDGGFNYMTTDLATVDYRLRTWVPDEIVYVVDDRQAPHFRKLFLTFARWQPEAAAKVKLVHVGFGKILGEDGKPFKTRSGDTVKLGDLLDEAEERALKVVTEKNPDLPEAERKEIARVVGLGAVKYADLLPNRQSDYQFSWDKMLALQGNTAPYLLYAYTRVRSIFRKGGADSATLTTQLPALNAPDEIALAKQLMSFGLVLEAVAEEYRPNFLCNYLYDLAGLFARFYESCPVLKAEGAERATRLLLCDLTGRVLKQGLEALGIETTEQM